MDILDQLEQAFFKHLRSLLDLVRGKSGKELDDLLVEQGRAEEEKRVIREMCEETDLEHEMMTELMNSDADPGEWLEKQIEDNVKESFPDATAEDIEEVKEAVLDSMENEIEEDAKMVEKEAEVILSVEAENGENDDQQSEEDQHHE